MRGDRTGVFYASVDGDRIEEKILPLEAPNGIGLSPDEDVLYVAETTTGRVWAFDREGPGRLGAGRCMLAQIPDFHLFDSLAVDVEDNVCVATIITGGATIHSPDGQSAKLVPMPDVLTINIGFGGDHLRTAFVTLSSTGRAGLDALGNVGATTQPSQQVNRDSSTCGVVGFLDTRRDFAG